MVQFGKMAVPNLGSEKLGKVFILPGISIPGFVKSPLNRLQIALIVIFISFLYKILTKTGYL